MLGSILLDTTLMAVIMAGPLPCYGEVGQVCPTYKRGGDSPLGNLTESGVGHCGYRRY